MSILFLLLILASCGPCDVRGEVVTEVTLIHGQFGIGIDERTAVVRTFDENTWLIINGETRPYNDFEAIRERDKVKAWRRPFDWKKYSNPLVLVAVEQAK